MHQLMLSGRAYKLDQERFQNTLYKENIYSCKLSVISEQTVITMIKDMHVY